VDYFIELLWVLGGGSRLPVELEPRVWPDLTLVPSQDVGGKCNKLNVDQKIGGENCVFKCHE